MKEKTKKILSGFLEAIGYSSAIAYTGILSWLVYKINKYGTISISEPSRVMRLFEMGAGGGTVLFLLHQFFKYKKKRGKELEKL